MLLQEDELAWKTKPRNGGLRGYCYRLAIPVLLFTTLVTTLALFIVIAQDYFGLYKPLPPKIYSESRHPAARYDLTLRQGPVERLLSYIVVTQEDSIHVATRYMAHRNNGVPSTDTDAAWAELYMGK